jgi:hypothetical protein
MYVDCCEVVAKVVAKWEAFVLSAQRLAVQRRAVEIGTAVGTTPHPKIAPISGREARPLQRRVGPLPRSSFTLEIAARIMICHFIAK